MSPRYGFAGTSSISMEFHSELHRAVRSMVQSSLETADDACAFAWVQFMREQPDRDQNWRGWLYRVAEREAWRLNALEWQERERVGKEGELIHQPDPRDRYDERIRFDAALQELKKLPPALQRVVLIRSQVWKHEEAAEVMGISVGAAVTAALAGAGWLVLISVYLTTFWWLAGQTPGMRFMGIRVTDVRGSLPSLPRALRRLVGMYLAAIPLGAGFLLVLVDDRRRGLHDRVARTLVVHVARPRRRESTEPDQLEPVVLPEPRAAIALGAPGGEGRVPD